MTIMYLNEPTWCFEGGLFCVPLSMHFKTIMNKLISGKSVSNINVTLPY